MDASKRAPEERSVGVDPLVCAHDEAIDRVRCDVIEERLVWHAMKRVDRGLVPPVSVRRASGRCARKVLSQALTLVQATTSVGLDDHARIKTLEDIDAMNRCLRCPNEDESPFGDPFCFVTPVREYEHRLRRQCELVVADRIHTHTDDLLPHQCFREHIRANIYNTPPPSLQYGIVRYGNATDGPPLAAC